MESLSLGLLGGLLIGLAASIMLLANGRVTGISGILNGLFTFQRGDMAWRGAFILGLCTGGVFLRFFYPMAFTNLSAKPIVWTVLAGLLVGFGTIMGGGCTSGHGVCGVSRLSPRSLVATIVFICSGILSVFIFQKLIGI